MLTVDLLHDFKLGPWRDFFAHIIRILEFLGPDKVQTFDERCVTQTPHLISCSQHLTLVSFRQVPVFGETTIRRFEGDVSEMKRLAGHDFEDLLQVSSYPCFFRRPLISEFCSASFPVWKGSFLNHTTQR